jgi:hypothetical protein
MLFYFVARLLAQPGGVGSYFCLVRCLSGGLVVLLELVIPPLSEKKKKDLIFGSLGFGDHISIALNILTC